MGRRLTIHRRSLRTLIEHWNGKAWKFVPSPNVGPGENVLIGVDAVSANDIWATGHRIPSSPDRTLIEHWNGHAWKVVPSPNPVRLTTILFSVSAVSAKDVWTVGVRSQGGPLRR